MIIFKLILASFKQNLRSGVQNFILGAQIYIYIYILKKKKLGQGAHLDPLALK